jgi:outer membrane lipoprotein-sorting protein
MKRILSITILMSLLITPFAYAADDVSIEDMIRYVDRVFRSDTSWSKIEMRIVTKNWSRTLNMDMWTEGMDRTLIHINSPKKDKGISTLRIDNDMWNFFPKINKVMKVPPSMMMSSWMGSDFTNDDLVKESSMLRDYTYEEVFPHDMQEGFRYVQLVPKEGSAIVWGKIIIQVRASDYLPVKEDFYDEKGKKVRVMNLTDIKELGGKTLPTTLEIIPLNKGMQRTVIKYLDARFDEPHKKGTFGLRNLQKKAR